MQPVAPDVAYLQTMISNVYFIGAPGSGDLGWTLVDAGMPFCANAIIRAAEKRFGPGARPQAILLTHGHFDHVGSLQALLRQWDVPVYAHRLELPYLTDQSSYPPPDPGVGGGAMAWSASLYPRGPIDLGERIRELPAGGSVPGLPGWRAIHTPGHTPGHVSFFRERDRILIAGDAFITVKQESLLAVLAQAQKIHGPPTYYTQDWIAARQSVQALAQLHPSAAGTGHGVPMYGDRLTHALQDLADKFVDKAIPSDGRYVRQPAIADEHGTVYAPPALHKPPRDLMVTLAVAAAAAGGIAALWTLRRTPEPQHHKSRPAPTPRADAPPAESAHSYRPAEAHAG